MLNKKTKKVFGKKIYLLGRRDGVNYWLEEPSWDCGWYWGFGYIETYTNNSCPERSRDIESHQHFDSLFFNKMKNGFDNYVEFFDDITLSEKDLWTFLELMNTFYALRKTADVCFHGGTNYSTNPCREFLKDEDMCKKINEIILPNVFKEIDNLLSE